MRQAMPCNPDELRHVPLFELLDDDEVEVLAAQVAIRRFAPHERIFEAGDPADHGYVVMSGKPQVAMMDEDHQEVVVEEPVHGEFFGFASMLQQSEHQSTATAIEETVCLEVGRDDITELVMHMPMAGMDMLTMQARQLHASQNLVRSRISRNPNEVIEEEAVGSRTGAVFRRSSLAVSPRFLWECLSSQTVNPFPAPATSHPACGFPALGAPVCFVPRFMGLIVLGRLSRLTIDRADSC
jgi:CRP-like cAMP-binding protein